MNDLRQQEPADFNPQDYFTPRFPDASTPAFPTLEAQPHSRRVPHLGHAILFIVITAILFAIVGRIFVYAHHPHGRQEALLLIQQPRTAVLIELVTYVLALIIAALLFPLFWDRPFSTGIQWNAATARRLAVRIIPAGIVLSYAVELLQSRLPQPEKMPIDNFFRHPADVWLITAFGTLLAPAFEEILFRGFLLPAFAIAWDWLTLSRNNPEAILRWQTTDTLSRPALLFSTILTSLGFIALHGAQYAYSPTALASLFFVSLIFTWTRLRLHSVAASALLHASYNFSVFLLLFTVTGGYRHLDRLTH